MSVPVAARFTHERGGEHALPPMLVRLVTGAAWLTLGAAKLVALRDAKIDSPGIEAIPFIAAAGETLLAIVILLPAVRGSWARLACGTSVAVATILLGLAWLLPEPQQCGCFGALGEAAHWQRVVAAAALIYFSLEWWSSLRRSLSQPADTLVARA